MQLEGMKQHLFCGENTCWSTYIHVCDCRQAIALSDHRVHEHNDKGSPIGVGKTWRPILSQQ